MTQALNLANFANNLNTAGQTSNSGLQNSSVTVTAGTGMSGGGAVALGSSVSIANAGVTSVTGAGTVSVSSSTGAITITGTGGAGTVTSVATGNGLSGGTITTSGTLSVACPSTGSVGSYGLLGINNSSVTAGSSYSGLAYSGVFTSSNCGSPSAAVITSGSSASGTWRAMGSANNQGFTNTTLFCRIA